MTGDAGAWPVDPDTLAAVQRRLGAARPPPWEPATGHTVAASYVCFARGLRGPGAGGDPGWAGAAVKRPGSRSESVVAHGPAGWAYEPGLLALREGPLRAAAVASLPFPGDVLLVDATGRDHPRRAGLALHLGAALGVPSVGVTDRPLLAAGTPPAQGRCSSTALLVDGEVVGYLLRTRPGVRAVVVHAAWRTTAQVAVAVVLGATRRMRTPQPLREARRAARAARGASG
ncbi:MAG: endonuclease V [Actinobacteria bacterium]|nr:endonuclease V [Actinomycetota bacterium]